ncbi:reverse transcriptase domain-containing protein [Tanacetum coccineum]
MKISSFMDAHKCPELAKRFSNKIPKMVDEMMTQLDDFIRSEEAFARTELPKGEATDASKRSMGLTSRREDRFNKGGYGAYRRRNKGRNTFNNRDGLVPYHFPAPYQAYRDQGRQRPRFNLSSLTKLPNEILTTEPQLNLQPPQPMSWPDDKKRKSVERDKSWMKVPILFPPLLVEDVLDEPLVIEAVMEGYLVRRVYLDQGASLEVMFKHCFENLSPAMKLWLRSTQMDLVGFTGGVVKPLGKIKLEDGLESSSSSVLNDTLHDEVSYPKRFRNPGHVDCDHCRMPEARKEANDGKKSQSKNSTRRGKSRKIRFNRTNVSQPSIPGSTSYDRGKPAERMQEPTQNVTKEKHGFFRMGTDGHNKGLKTQRDTYQRLVDTAFQSQIRRNLEAYVDDMVIKSNDEKILIADNAEKFDNLRKINMKLNPKKCSFGVEEGKFLGYMVTSEGIRANPKKTKAIADMQSPQNLKEMQSLSRKLAALKSFLSRSAEKSLPYFKTLKDITKENKDEYCWTESAERAFQEMKQCIVGLPLLTTPVKEETLYVYLTGATEALSAVLLTKRKGKQCPIHYVNKILNEAERNYAPMEKLALSLLHMSRRLRRYFEAHPIKVITDQPLKQILNKAQASGTLAKYSVELGAYNIAYELINVIKGQALAEFLSKALVETHPEEFF